MLLTLGLGAVARGGARTLQDASFLLWRSGAAEGRGWDFFKRGWWLWLLTPLAIYVLPLLPFVYGAYKAVEWQWWLSGIRFGGVRLESTLPRSALIGLYWKVIGWIVAAGLVFAAYVALCAVLVASMAATPLTQFFASQEIARSIPLLVLMGLGYLMFALAINVVIRFYLMRDLWVRVLGSAIVTASRAANVSARGTRQRARRRLCHGLDVAGFRNCHGSHRSAFRRPRRRFSVYLARIGSAARETRFLRRCSRSTRRSGPLRAGYADIRRRQPFGCCG
jgi:hypothetical protein